MTEGISSDSPAIVVPDRSHLQALSGIKWNKHGPEVIPAWVADMDIRAADCVTNAIMDVVGRGDFGYNLSIVDQLAPTFADWQLEQHGWEVDVDKVKRLCDVLHGVDTTLHLYTEPGDGVILLTPVYPPFLKSLEDNRCRLIGVPLERPDWRLDPERLEAAVDEGTKVILLCNPHNPTGRTFDQEELEAVVDVAARHNLVIIADEVWGDLVHPEGRHLPLSSLGEEADQLTVTMSSASKTFNLAGLRCAVTHLGHPEIRRRFEELPSHMMGAVSTPGAAATLAAWTQGKPWLEALRAHLTARRDQLASRLADELPEIRFELPQATYLAWLDLGSLGLGDDPATSILETGDLALSAGTAFSTGGLGHVRLNYATSAELLDEIIDRMVKAVNQLRG